MWHPINEPPPTIFESEWEHIFYSALVIAVDKDFEGIVTTNYCEKYGWGDDSVEVPNGRDDYPIKKDIAWWAYMPESREA